LLVEIAELSSFVRTNNEDIKAMLSTQVDRTRIVYDRHTKNFPRTAVFVGTTNDDEYLKDPTGARRFWPVKVHQINEEYLKEFRNQFFAEAAHRYKAGESWWEVPQEEAEEIQDSRRIQDPFEAFIRQYTIGKTVITVEELLTECLKYDKSHIPPSPHRVTSTLRNVGFQPRRDREHRYWARRDYVAEQFSTENKIISNAIPF